jgi:hypothetical protein
MGCVSVQHIQNNELHIHNSYILYFSPLTVGLTDILNVYILMCLVLVFLLTFSHEFNVWSSRHAWRNWASSWFIFCAKHGNSVKDVTWKENEHLLSQHIGGHCVLKIVFVMLICHNQLQSLTGTQIHVGLVSEFSKRRWWKSFCESSIPSESNFHCTPGEDWKKLMTVVWCTCMEQ